MKTRIIVLALVLAAIAVFAAANWSAITAPTELSLLVATVQAPLGLVMLALLVLLTLLFLAFIVFLQTSVIREARRQARELQLQRELADKAEASRFTELKSFLDSRLEQLDRDVRGSVEQAGNTLAAYIGELEDRLEGRSGKDDRSRPA